MKIKVAAFCLFFLFFAVSISGVVSAVPSPSISVSSTCVNPGETVYVTVENGPGYLTDWVSRYLASETDSQLYSQDWKYLNGLQTPPPMGQTSAVLTFHMPTASGIYNFRFFANDGYELLATSPSVQVKPPATSWKLIGPGGGGRITAVTEDPKNSQNLYMTINVGGARRSCDGGKTWEIINRGFDYISIGESAQRLADIWVHPLDGNHVLAAGLNGYVYAMDNTGSSTEWTPIYKHPGGLDIDFSKFTSDPNNPNVVYLGVGSIQKLILGVGARRTGNYWPALPSDDPTSPTILRFKWKENDEVWERTDVGSIVGTQREGGQQGKLNIYSIAVNPSDTRKMWFVTERGLYKGRRNSDETISSFTLVSDPAVPNGLPAANDIHGGKIVIHPNGTTMYFTALNICPLGGESANCPDPTSTTRGGVYRSSNGGDSWEELTNGTRGLDNGNSNYFDIVIDPKEPGTVFLAQTTVEDGPDGTLYRFSDGGDSWQNMITVATPGTPGNFEPGWLPMDKYGPDFLSVSRFGQTLRWSIGGGRLFEGSTTEPQPFWTNLLTKRVGTVEQETWTTTGSEAIALAYSIAIDPKNSDIVYLPYGDHAYFKSTDGGGSVKVLTTFKYMKDSGNKGDSGTLIVDELDSNRVYAATQGPHQQLEDGGVMYSSERGESWKTIGGHDNDNLPRGAMLDLMVEYDGNTRNLYVANYGKNENEDAGGVFLLNNPDNINNPSSTYNWVKIFDHDCTHAIAARDNFTTLFVGVDDDGDSTSPSYGLYKLKKYPSTPGWQTAGGPIDLEGSKVFYDMETGGESGTIYVATDIGLFKIDQSDSVTRLFPFSPVPTGSAFPVLRSAVEVHPKNEDIICFAHDRGEVLKSTDRGDTWTKISSEIPTLGFVTLKLDPNSDTIYVAGPGSGVWKKTFDTCILP